MVVDKDNENAVKCKSETLDANLLGGGKESVLCKGYRVHIVLC